MQEPSQLKVLFNVAALLTKLGGPVRSVPFLAEAVARRSNRAVLVSQIPFGSPPSNNVIPDVALVDTRLASGLEILKLGTIISLSHHNLLLNAARETGCNLIHDNGLWLPANYSAASVAKRLGIPLICSPRGALGNWALRQSSAKKRIAMLLYQQSILESVACFFATSNEEAQNIRDNHFAQPIAIIPNGVHMPTLESSTRAVIGPRKALYLSRIAPQKGPDILIEAWASVRPKGWQLVIAGPGKESYVSEIRKRVKQLGVTDSVKFIGEVTEQNKSAVYNSAELFVLPTRHENFGIVIAEAMSHRLPVLTTLAAPWPELEAKSCGWRVTPDVESFATGLRTATSQNYESLRGMGERARSHVESHYSWEAVAGMAMETYAWLVNPAQHKKPNFVRLD